MKPRLNTPPGIFSHSSFSSAAKKRGAMRVAKEISSRETPRISRSRFRCSPKGVEDMRAEAKPHEKYRRRARVCQCGEENSGKRTVSDSCIAARRDVAVR